MDIDTYNKLRKVAATVRLSPEQTYGMSFNSSGEAKVTPQSAKYDKASQQARREAFLKAHPGEKLKPDDYRLPVILYPHSKNKNKNYLNLSQYDIKHWNNPLEIVYGKDLPVGPATLAATRYDNETMRRLETALGIKRFPVPEMGITAQVYPGTDKRFEAIMKAIRENKVKLHPNAVREVNTALRPENNNLKAFTLHEAANHGATLSNYNKIPAVYDDEQFNDLRSMRDTATQMTKADWKNPRHFYGLLPEEMTGGMHSIKGAWAQKHPDIELSQDWDVAHDQLKRMGYIDDDGMFNDKLWEGTGYNAFLSTINSPMEFLNNDSIIKDPKTRSKLRTNLLKQMRWYWPQAKNLRGQEQLQQNINPNYNYYRGNQGIPS